MHLWEKINKIEDKDDFLEFMDTLVNDFKKNKSEWETTNVDEFLLGLASWVEDMEGFYENMGIEIPVNIDWKFIANALSAARICE